MAYIGIDLGGISVAAALLNEQGEILARRSTPTPQGPDSVAAAIAGLVRDLLAAGGAEVSYVGIGSPGTIDPEAGVVEYWSNLDFRHVPLAKMVEERTGLPALLENDANCAALGEYIAGAGRGSGSLVVITLGTGIGGGAVLNGKLYTGFNYAGMEVGHFVIVKGGRACTCGREGCFETYCSATALIRQARLAMEREHASLLWELAGAPENVTGKLVFEAYARGDETASAVVREFVDYLGCGVANLINIFQPEVFAIGGGIAGAGETLMAPVRAILERENYARHNSRKTKLVLAELGNDAGLIGAAMFRAYRG